MRNSYLALGALGGGLALYMASGSGSPKSTLEFTKPALPPTAAVDLRPGLSSVFVALPVEIGALSKRMDAALPEQLLQVRDWLPDAACMHRGARGHECNNARLEGTITRNGPVEFKVEPNGFKIVVPIKYDLTATGLGWASALTERKSGETSTSVSFGVTISPSNGLDIAVRDDATAAPAALTLLKGSIKLGRLLEPGVRPVMKSAESDLRRALAALPVKAAVARVWNVLSAPLELGEGSRTWLRGAPEYYTTGRFVTEQGRLQYQMAIATRLAVVEAKREQLPTSKHQPVRALDTPPVASNIRVAMPIDLEAVRQAAEAAFVKDQVLETRADRFSEPIKVTIRGTRVYPALRQIGLELDVAATSHKGKVFNGKLHLVGRPVIDAATGTVTLADVTFPLVSSKETNTGARDAPRLGTEPFASTFAAVARLDISRPLAEALPRVTQLLSQRIGDDLVLAGSFKQVAPVSFELTSDGALLLVDVTGDVAFTYANSTEAAAAATLAAHQDAGPTGRATVSSSTSAAPAVMAAAAAATAVASRAVSIKRAASNPKPTSVTKPRSSTKSPIKQTATLQSRG